jgi:biotin carboxyl carrier protein
METVEIEVGGRTLTGTVEKIQGTLWVHVNGKCFAYEPRRRMASTAPKAKCTEDLIVAPMPGKVTKVHVRQGDVVEAHQTLVVLEAMKMQYYLKASADGVIHKVECRDGEQVELNQPLIKYGATSKEERQPLRVILTLEDEGSKEISTEGHYVHPSASTADTKI